MTGRPSSTSPEAIGVGRLFCGVKVARFARDDTERASTKPSPVERDQALPVALGGGLVVAPALREGEAVMDAGLDLELASVARLVEQRLQLLHHVGRRELVVLGAGDVELAP